jgi:competence protein ComEC
VDENLGWIGRVHRRTDAALGYGLHPQEAAVVRGMVLGDRSLIPEDLEEAFQKSGITQTLALIWPYILVAGAPPSAIRAGVVATLVLVAGLLGRQISPLHCTN